jgi:hypothetical protein
MRPKKAAHKLSITVWTTSLPDDRMEQLRSRLNASTALCIRHQMIERAVVGQGCVNGPPVPDDDTIGLSACQQLAEAATGKKLEVGICAGSQDPNFAAADDRCGRLRDCC